MSNAFDEFFQGGGGEFAPSLKFKNGSGPGGQTEVGGGVIGTIVSMHQQDQTKQGGNEKVPDGKGGFKQQVQIILQTDLRNWDKVAKIPTDKETGAELPASEDDGRRAIYVKGWMTGAIGDAVAEATGKPGAPEIGGKLGVKVTELVPTDKGNPYPKYKAVYTPPAAGQALFEQAAGGPTTTVAEEQRQAALSRSDLNRRAGLYPRGAPPGTSPPSTDERHHHGRQAAQDGQAEGRGGGHAAHQARRHPRQAVPDRRDEGRRTRDRPGQRQARARVRQAAPGPDAALAGRASPGRPAGEVRRGHPPRRFLSPA
jgi:hypothetical protein